MLDFMFKGLCLIIGYVRHQNVINLIIDFDLQY
jgi:hypothetical protein